MRTTFSMKESCARRVAAFSVVSIYSCVPHLHALGPSFSSTYPGLDSTVMGSYTSGRLYYIEHNRLYNLWNSI